MTDTCGLNRPRQPLFQASPAGLALRKVWTFPFFLEGRIAALVQAACAIDHSTLGASSLYQGMNGSHAATTGAMTNRALRVAVAYCHKPQAQLAAFNLGFRG
jgi:hypothetical protein